MTRTILYLNAMGEISGAERSLLAMLDALDRTQWRPVVAAPAGALLRTAEQRMVEVVPLALAPLNRPRSPLALGTTLCRLRAGWRALAAALRDISPALIHANTTLAMLYTLRAKAPVVWQVRDLALGRWARLLARRATRIAVISATVARALPLPARGDAGKLVTLPPAVDTGHFHPEDDRRALRRQLGMPVDLPLIGLVAQFVPWKRHHLFLDALERLQAHPWHAVLCGADFGRDRAYVAGIDARLAAPPLAGRVTRLPWLDDPAPLYAALDLCALTSDHEPFGRALIEAMACAIPVVAVAEGGPCDIVQDGGTGLLTPPTPEALAAAFALLLDDEHRRTAFGAAARSQVEQRFSLPVQRAVLNRLYGEVLDSREGEAPTETRACDEHLGGTRRHDYRSSRKR